VLASPDTFRCRRGIALTTSIRTAYLTAAESVATLLADPAIEAAWTRPSALDRFHVSGLAGHLAAQVINVPRVLGAPAHPGAPISLLDHYDQVRWRGADLDEPTNVRIREDGESLAEAGPEKLAKDVADAAASAAAIIAREPADRIVHLAWTGWSLTLDDYLTTRAFEIAVHNDDLAASVGCPTPELPEDVTRPVLDLLVTLAARRHGATAVLRALARAERAPATIAAI
jgi:hypothetical protein